MILELSQYNSQQVIGNGEWVNNFAPVTLNTGDSITINQAFIDGQLSGDYDNIAITSQIDISMTFGFYYMNVQDGHITYSKGDGVAAELYVARYNMNPNFPLITQVRQVTVPAGNYSPAELAQTINMQLTAIPRVSVSEFNDLTNMFLRPSQATTFTLPCQDFNPYPDTGPYKSGYLTYLMASIIPIPQIMIDEFPAGSQVTISFEGSSGYKFSYPNITIESIDQATGKITLPPTAIALNSSQYNVKCMYVKLSSAAAKNIVFTNQSDATDTMTFSTAAIPPRYFGATQIALEYNVNNSGKFQWTYQHMPMYDTATKDEGVSVFADGNGILRLADVRSGIFWTDLQPRNFWEGLGFNMSSLLVVDGDNVLQTPLVRGVNITSAFSGLDIFIASSRSLPVIPDGAYFYSTTQTNPIIAPNNYTGTDGGFYIIEVLGLATDYQDDKKSYCAVMSVGSRNYDQNGFITIYGDGSIPFVNNGDPRTITTLHVRILDPITKQPTKLLGSRNSVFLNIQRTQPPSSDPAQ